MGRGDGVGVRVGGERWGDKVISRFLTISQQHVKCVSGSSLLEQLYMLPH